MYDTNRKMPEIPEPESAMNQMKQDVISVVIIVSIFYVIITAAKIIWAPFRFLFLSDRRKFAKALEQAKEKILLRRSFRYQFENDPMNPLTQYVERFKIHPEKYKHSLDNNKYKNWYISYVKGEALDSNLYFAPDVYTNGIAGRYGDKVINGKFISYLKQQYNLHQTASSYNRRQFLKTIDMFYPEFTPKFSVLADQIQEMEYKVKEIEVQRELMNKLTSMGIPEHLSIFLVMQKLTKDNFRKYIDVIKFCEAKGYCYAMSKYCIENNYDPSLPLAPAVNIILDNIESKEMAGALIRGDITVDDVTEMSERYDNDSSDKPQRMCKDFEELMHTRALEIRKQYSI